MTRLVRVLFLLLLAMATPLAAQICTSTNTVKVIRNSATRVGKDSVYAVYVKQDSVRTRCKLVGGTDTVTVQLPGRVDTVYVTKPDTVKPPVPVDTTKPPVVVAGGCQATDLLCEDFEGPTGWYPLHCDSTRNVGGGSLAGSNGWCGTISNNPPNNAWNSGTGPITPPKAVRCGNVGIRSNCAATTGVMQGSTTGNMADKALTKGVTELTVAFYTKPLTGYTFGAEKMLTFNDGVAGGGGIRFGNLSWNCASNPSSTGNVTMGFPVPMDVCQSQNLGNALTITAGNWYAYQVHYKLSSPGQRDGVFELWLDNCGPTGTACPATRTLRMRRTDVNNNRSAGEMIRVLWLEAWSNPVSRGERYWDNVRAVEGNQMIGF